MLQHHIPRTELTSKITFTNNVRRRKPSSSGVASGIRPGAGSTETIQLVLTQSLVQNLQCPTSVFMSLLSRARGHARSPNCSVNYNVKDAKRESTRCLCYPGGREQPAHYPAHLQWRLGDANRPRDGSLNGKLQLQTTTTIPTTLWD